MKPRQTDLLMLEKRYRARGNLADGVYTAVSWVYSRNWITVLLALALFILGLYRLRAPIAAFSQGVFDAAQDDFEQGSIFLLHGVAFVCAYLAVLILCRLPLWLLHELTWRLCKRVDFYPRMENVFTACAEDAAELARYANASADPALRKAAVAHITDRERLGALSLQSGQEDVRLYAALALDDDRLMRFAVLRIANPKDRIRFLLNASNPKLNTVIALSDPDPDVRNCATRYLTGVPELVQLAQEDPHPRVRQTAVLQLLNITQQEAKTPHGKRALATLTALARSDADPCVRRIAITAVTDPQVLAQAALEDADETVRANAIPRVKDAGVLAKVALQEPFGPSRRIAIQAVHDQPTLIQVARNDADVQARQLAIQQLTDQETLAWIARRAETPLSHKLLAIMRLTDQATLGHIARTDPSLNQEAARRLHAQDQLAETALTALSEFVRTIAIDKVDDPLVLAQLLALSQPISVRLAAAERLNTVANDDAVSALADALQDPETSVRISVAATLRRLYRKSRYRERILALQGTQVRAHADFTKTVFTDNHVDETVDEDCHMNPCSGGTHSDWHDSHTDIVHTDMPEVLFTL